MKTQVRKNSGKYINLILLCVLLTFWIACEGKIDVDQATTCGVGNGHHDFNLFDYPPTTFNCNYEGSFQIYLMPNIDSSFAGFNRLWFELEKDGEIYRSNYVEFYSGDTTTQMLEWGGSLPSGVYEMRGYMNNIQLDSYCEDSIYWKYDDRVGYISITEFSDPEKVMEIEYFCQDSDIGTIDRYDVFLSPNTEEYIDIAFNIANTTYNKTTYQTDLEPEVIEYDPYDPSEIKNYILNLKYWEDEMFLCGIKAFKDVAGNLLPDRLGATYEDDSVTRAPSYSTGSLIAVKTCIDYAASDEYRLDYNHLVTAMTIHELGLQRGAVWDEHDSTWPYPKFCIGNEALIIWLARARAHPYWTTRYSNPHFCDECITGIKNIDW